MEVRIRIDKKQVEILDYPNYENWVSLNDEGKELLDSSQKYSLGLYLYGKSDSISIEEIKVVEE